MTKEIKLAIVGVGNCASSLLQGLEYCMMKHPPLQMRDSDAFAALEKFISGQTE